MLARRFCVFNVSLKVDAAREIITVIMTLNDENVSLRKRHTVVWSRVLFLATALPFLGLTTHYHEVLITRE